MPPLFAALFALVGCPKPSIPLGQTVIEDIRFEGNDRRLFSHDGQAALRDAVETRGSRHLVDLPGRLDFGPYLGDIATLDEDVLAEDGARLVTWYAHHGWFDAKFLGWTVVPRRLRGPGGAARADLVGRVDPGAQSVLDTDPELIGLDTLAAPIRADLKKLVALHAGDTFDLDDYTDTLDSLSARLHERGYAYASVSGHVTVRPDLHQVHIRYTLVPGRPCVFGEITVVGDKAAERRVRMELDFAAGDGFRTSKLLAARQRLYGLGVYGLVEVTPRLTTPDERIVPVTVRLSRRPSRVVEVGPALAVESNRQVLSVDATFADDDAFDKLWRWKAEGSLGVATTVDVSQTEAFPVDEQINDSITPTGKLAQTLTIPDLVGDQLALVASSDVHHDVTSTYRLFQASATPALSYTPDRRITTSLGYRFQYTKYYDYADLRAVKTTKLSIAVRPQSFLSMLQQKLTWDARDDKLAPTRNYFVSVGLDEAGGPFGGDDAFFRVTGDFRGYRGLRVGDADRPHTVLAGRLGGGVIAPYTDGDGVDIGERLRLGGGTTVRGWAEDRLGPHLCYDATTQELDTAPDGTPLCAKTDIIEGVGGLLSVYGNLELRQDLPWNAGFVLFVDAGRVWDDVARASVDGVQWSVGAGLRYHSPIGPIRADFGWVPVPDDYFAAEPGWQFHLGIGEAF